jgi:hypothetical protein
MKNPDGLDVDHLQSLLRAHSRRLKILELREATYGISCPPEILIEIEDIKQKIKNIQIQTTKLENSQPSNNDQLNVVSQDKISKWVSKFLKDQIKNRLQFTAYDVTLALKAKYPKLDISHKNVRHSVHTMMRLIVELRMYRRVIAKYGKNQAQRYEPITEQ